MTKTTKTFKLYATHKKSGVEWVWTGYAVAEDEDDILVQILMEYDMGGMKDLKVEIEDSTAKVFLSPVGTINKGE